MRTLLFGEIGVDLVHERPVASLGDATSFVPRLGGAVANVAVHAAASGAPVAVAGVAGADPWGAWLRERLTAAGVDAAPLHLDGGARTPVAFTTVDPHGVPARDVLGAGVPPYVEEALLAAVEQSGALVLTSATIAGEEERRVTFAARDAALAAGRPVVVDADLRPHRWETPAIWASEARQLVKGAFLMRAGAEEARLLTGEDEPVAAADGLVAMGATHALVTTPHGAVVRGGGLRLHRVGRASGALGADDAFLGVILARLAGTDFYAPAIAAALPDAVAAAARAVERWTAHG